MRTDLEWPPVCWPRERGRSDVIERAAEACGGLAKLAEALGMSAQAVWNWRIRGVPLEHCAAMEQVSGVMRWDLRPDDWYRIWPELVGAKGAPRVPEAA